MTQPPPSGRHPAADALAAFRQAASARFELLGTLGQGSMGVVYHARDRALGRDLALKVLLHVGPRQAARFQREAELTARLEHPGIVRVHSAGILAHVPYIAYELVSGHRLDETIPNLDRDQRVRLVRDAARALGYAHTRGVVHRDVKPQNILVDAEGRLRVADFGLATAQDVDRLTQSHALLGTLEYMAPEQVTASGELGPPADVWALGVILYEALCDRRPFAEDNLPALMVAIAEARLESPRTLDPEIPAALEQVCLRALAASPAERYPHGEALAADLDRFLAGDPVVAGPRPLRVPLALAAVALLGVGSALWLTRSQPAPATAGSVAVVESAEGLAEASPAGIAPVATPTLFVERALDALVPGITGGPVRVLKVQGQLLLALEEVYADPNGRGLRHHRHRDTVLRVYDEQTLEPVRAVRAHPDGSSRLATTAGLAATGATDRVVKLWELPGLTLRGELTGFRDRIVALAFSPGGDRLLVADKQDLSLWRVQDGAMLWRRPGAGDCWCATSLPSGDGFLLAANRKPGEAEAQVHVERWSTAGELLASVPSRQSWRIAVNEAGTRALTLGWGENKLVEWRLDGEQPLTQARELELHAHWANDFMPDPAWEHVVVVSGTGEATKLSLADGTLKRQRLFSREILVAMAAAEDRLYLAGVDHKIHRTGFEALQRAPLAGTREHEGALNASDWTASCAYPLHSMLDPNAQARETSDRGPFALTSVSAAGLLRYVRGAEESLLLLIPRFEPGAPEPEPQALVLDETVTALALLPNPERFLIAFDDGSVHLGDIRSRPSWRELKAATATEESRRVRAGSKQEPITPQTLALCVARELVFAAGEEDAILGWDLGDPERPAFQLRGHTPPVLALATRRDRLFAGEGAGAVSVFSLEERELERRLVGPAPVTALLPWAGGSELLVAYEDGHVWHWDVEREQVLGVWRAPDADLVRCFGRASGRVQLGTQLSRWFQLSLETDRDD